MRDRVFVLLPEKDGAGLVTRAIEAGFGTFVTRGPLSDVAGLARARWLRLDGEGLHDAAGALAAPLVTIRSVDDQARALALAGKHDAVLVDATDWRVIPFENLIAAYRARGTRLLALARDAADAKLLLETLESGVDTVLVPVADALKLPAAHAGVETLVEATISLVKPVGLGDRACLDTASLLAEDEGVLTGSTSHGLFLVASEARDSGYVASRPFRVNAGAVHAYVLLPGGRTKYLSELKAGDEVLASDSKGRTRSVVLGRVKVERRPFLLLEADAPDGRRVSTLLQNAETIRLVTAQGTKSVVQLSPGDKVLVRLDEAGAGRHFGMRVDETIQER